MKSCKIRMFLLMFASAGIVISLAYAGDLLFAEIDKSKTTDKTLSEEEIFKEDTVTPSDKIKDDALSAAIEKKSLTFNGFLNSRTSVKYKRSSILRDIDLIDTSNFLSYFQSNYQLDARLIKGIRGYVNVSADYYPTGLLQSSTQQSALQY